MMRAILVVLHRWVGLFIAAFLLVAALTGTVISWDHELDEWLNPHLFETGSVGGKTLAPVDLAAIVEAADPRRRVIYFPTQFKPGVAAAFGVTGRIDPITKRQYEIGHSQVFLDPATGRILGQRDWGKAALDREHLLPFLYKLHYSLHVPSFADIDRWGIWFMGVVGLVWLFDCFVGFYLTLPGSRRRLRASPGAPEGAAHVDAEATDVAASAATGRSWWQRWKPAWQIKWRASSYRVNLDLHRAFGLWLWGLLLILAFTSLSMNLQFEVVRPALNLVSKLTPNPFELRTPRSPHAPVEPKADFAVVLDRASREAAARGWSEPVGFAFYSPEFGIYVVGFHPLGGDPHDFGGLVVKRVYLDSADGRILGDEIPLKGTAADVFMQLQFPLHSGRIAGIPGRIVISLMGVVVALLSITGIVIFLKKRAVRIKAIMVRAQATARVET
jgi:uncharacterized iron-regulated membrane protein